MRPGALHLCSRDGLHNPVNMNGLPTRVGPEADIDLIRSEQLANYCRGMPHDRSHFSCLSLNEIGDVEHMAPRLDHQSANPEWPDTMLDSQVGRLEDAATRRLLSPFSEVAGEAALHLGNSNPLRRRRTFPRTGARVVPAEDGWAGLTDVFQQLGSDTTDVGGMWVYPEHRRRGIGRALLEAAVHWSAERHAQQVSLTVVTSNRAAIALYESAGFRVEGEPMLARTSPTVLQRMTRHLEG